mgnify:CR=1 FL=1
MIRRLSSGVALVAMLTVGLVSQSQAAYYGDFAGSSISFRDVQDVNGLYGVPVVQANSLVFTPMNFEIDCASSATCPPTPATVDDILLFDVETDPGISIERIVVNEEGTTLLDDFDLPGAFAATTVVGNVFIDVTALNGVAITGLNLNAQMNFTSLGTYDTLTEGNGTHLWSGVLAVNIDDFLAANGYPDARATGITVSLANTLTAYAANGAVASIRKEEVRGLAVKVIPEPGTALLMGLGLAGLAANRRRRC